jgi:centrosomal protein CEP76
MAIDSIINNLGCGMDAYVAFGKDRHGNDRIWVVTTETDRTTIMIHWDPLSGYHYEHNALSNFPFSTIDCLFNHERLFANIQPSNQVSDCQKDLSVRAAWKPLVFHEVYMLLPNNQNNSRQKKLYLRPNVMWNEVDKRFEMEESLMKQLRLEVESFREQFIDAGTICWDEKLSDWLRQPLWMYEMQRLTATEELAAPTQLFQTGIQTFIERDQTFKVSV